MLQDFDKAYKVLFYYLKAIKNPPSPLRKKCTEKNQQGNKLKLTTKQISMALLHLINMKRFVCKSSEKNSEAKKSFSHQDFRQEMHGIVPYLEFE